jgi:hypothetical protein
MPSKSGGQDKSCNPYTTGPTHPNPQQQHVVTLLTVLQCYELSEHMPLQGVQLDHHNRGRCYLSLKVPTCSCTSRHKTFVQHRDWK